MRIALIFDKTRADTTGMYFERACRSLGLACDHWWLRDAARIPAAYDLYLRIDHGDDYTTDLPDRLRPAIFYAIDTHLPHSWKKIRRTASRFDAVFCCHADAARQLPGAEWLPLACDPAIHGAVPSEPVWDVAFVGTEGGMPRKFYLQALRERYPNSCIGGFDYTEMASIYSRARIGFNYSIANDVNMRLFEVLAAKTLLVTNALKGDDLSQLGLHDREQLVLYRNPRDLFECIDYFLNHADERERIAQAGYAAVMERHTYVHRMQQLLTSVSRRLGVQVPPRAVAPSPEPRAPSNV